MIFTTQSKAAAVLMDHLVSFKTFFIMVINPRLAIAVAKKIKMNRKLK